MEKKAKSIGTVRKRERELKFKKDKKIEIQKNCVCLGYKDGLIKLVCLFCACNSS